MTSREEILNRIQQNKPEQCPLPESCRYEVTSDKTQLLSRFKENLARAGAEVIECFTGEELDDYLDYGLHNVVNMLDENTRARFIHGEVSETELEKTETAIVKGDFGVAENGAVWLDESDLTNRLLPFVTQKLVLVLEKTKLVPTMHEAYQQTTLSKTGFGLFIAGPSKTADIEQSLVYGAHGAKTLVVVLL